MLITTTENLEGKKIIEYKGLVTAQAIFEAAIFDQIDEDPKNTLSGRLTKYEESFQNIRNIALQELQENALEMGANTIVGLSLDYETMGKGSMIIICISGTAVVIE